MELEMWLGASSRSRSRSPRVLNIKVMLGVVVNNNIVDKTLVIHPRECEPIANVKKMIQRAGNIEDQLVLIRNQHPLSDRCTLASYHIRGGRLWAVQSDLYSETCRGEMEQYPSDDEVDEP